MNYFERKTRVQNATAICASTFSRQKFHRRENRDFCTWLQAAKDQVKTDQEAGRGGGVFCRPFQTKVKSDAALYVPEATTVFSIFWPRSFNVAPLVIFFGWHLLLISGSQLVLVAPKEAKGTDLWKRSLEHQVFHLQFWDMALAQTCRSPTTKCRSSTCLTCWWISTRQKQTFSQS